MIVASHQQSCCLRKWIYYSAHFDNATRQTTSPSAPTHTQANNPAPARASRARRSDPGSDRRPDHGPVPARLARPLAQAPPAEDEGEDEDEVEPQADHGHCYEGGLHADGVHHGVDVEWYHEGDDVLEAAD